VTNYFRPQKYESEASTLLSAGEMRLLRQRMGGFKALYDEKLDVRGVLKPDLFDLARPIQFRLRQQQ